MKKSDLRIVFMGTPHFAVATLEALVNEGYNVVAVVTQPDKPVGRHASVLQPPPVKLFAQRHGIPVLQPEKMKDPAFVQALRACDANLQVVVAFRMLPEIVWAMPRYGTFNVHAALLPDYRGAAPINWAIINGETITGVTTFFLDRQIDTGRIIRQTPVPIPDDADAATLHDALMHLGARICLETLSDIISADGSPEALPQDDSLALHTAPKLFKDNCRISWAATAHQVRNLIRGLSPTPGAWTMLTAPDGTQTPLKIFAATLLPPATSTPPAGTVVRDRKSLCVACADALLRIDSLQPAGKKRMEAQALLNGMPDIEKYSLV